MRGEIIIVPTPQALEMLKSSAQVLAKHLVKTGIKLNDQISLCPDRRRLQHAISTALDRADIVFILGGMGRDSQFLAKQVVSEGLGLTLETSPEVLAAIREFAARTGFASSADDVTLASLPSGSRPLIPVSGVVPGCIVSSSTQHIVMLPENIEELAPMLSRQVIPALSKIGVKAESVHYIRTYGASEEQIRKLIIDLMGTTNPVVTTLNNGGEVIVKVVANALTIGEATKLSGPVLRSVANRLGDYAYGLDVDNIETALVQKLDRKDITIAVAESATDSRFLKRLKTIDKTATFKGGIACDDIDSKVAEFGIKKRLIKKEGEVSEFSAVVLANGAREKFNTDIGVGITTNIVSAKKKEELVAYISVCDNKYAYNKKIYIDEHNSKNITATIDAAVTCAFNMARLFVDYSPEPYPHSIPLDRALARKISVTDKSEYDTGEALEEAYPDFEYQQEHAATPRKGRKIRNFLLLIAVLAIVGSVVYFAFYGVQSFAARAMRDDLAAVYNTLGIGGLRALNSDTVAYVSIDDTILQYPIVQSEDNKYYLRRDFNEKNNDNGIPFMDYRSSISEPSDNLIVYGHNMRDGQIFGELLNYKDLEYYKQHPLINFETTKKDGVYKVFAVYITSANAAHFNNGKVYDYTSFIDAGSEEEFENYIYEARIRSLLHLPVDVAPDDEIITLSTCDYDFFDSRYVVLARRVRSDESPSVDTELAEYNPTPLFPDVWYELYGGIKPDVASWEFPLAADIPKAKSKAVEDLIVSTPPKKEDETDTADKAEEKEKVATELATVSAQTPVTEKPKTDAEKKAEADKQAQLELEAKQKLEAEQKVTEAAAVKEKEEAERKAKEAEALKVKIATAEAEIKKQLEIADAAYATAVDNKNLVLAAKLKSDAETPLTATKDAATKAANAHKAAKAQLEVISTDSAKASVLQAEIYALDAGTVVDEAARHYDTLPEANSTSKPDSAIDGSIVNTSSGLKVSASVNFDPNSDLDILSRIVQQEVGSSFNAEAIKAQAVAAYSYIANRNSIGITPSVYMASSVSSKVKNAVAEVLGQGVYYNNRIAYTTYHAINAGVTTKAVSAWGGSYDYDYLQSVDSSVDQAVKGYKVSKKMSAADVSDRLYSVLGIDATGDPSGWFEILNYDAGVYNSEMTVCGYTHSQRKGSKITGPLLREYVLNLRSAAFDIDYDSGSDSFTFTTYGYGHGVGMSQLGANEYAKQGWSYVEILKHYYPGTTVG